MTKKIVTIIESCKDCPYTKVLSWEGKLEYKCGFDGDNNEEAYLSNSIKENCELEEETWD